MHQFLNVGVLVEKKFVTSLQIGELVVVVLDENPQTQHNELIDVIDALELKLLDDIDETHFDVVENRPFD